MKGKLLLIPALSTIALNTYAAEVKVLKHTEQLAPHTKLTLTTLKDDVNPMLKLKSYATHHADFEQLVTATSKLNSIDLIPGINSTVVRGDTMYMVWNMSKVPHTYTVGRNLCVSLKNDGNVIGNCSFVDDVIYVKANDVAYLHSEIQANQNLTAGQLYYINVGISVQDESNSVIFASDDGKDYTPPTSTTTK